MAGFRSLIWVFYVGRTCPGRIHRFNPPIDLFDDKGKKIGEQRNAIAVVELLADEWPEDVASGEGVRHKKLEVTHLDNPKGGKWGPNGEWLGARGNLFLYEDEVGDKEPHDIFKEYEAIRSKPPVSETGHTEDVGEPGNAGEGPAPTPAEKEGEEVPNKEEDAPSGKEHLPETFPHVQYLRDDGITTWGRLRKIVAAGKLQDVPGIGREKAKDIEAEPGVQVG